MRKPFIASAVAATLAAAVPSAAQDAFRPPQPAVPMPGVDPARMERLINTLPDNPGTGRFPAMKEEDRSLPNHTVYRPADLAKLGTTRLGIVVWGNGGCMDDGAFTRFHLLELASHGYLVIANGAIRSGPGKPPLQLVPPPGAPAPKPPPAGAAPPPPRTTPSMLVDAIDWAIAENARPGSPYRGRIDTNAVAVSGGSCGGLQALEVASQDPRVKTAVIHNSGIIPGMKMPGLTIEKSALDRLRGPVLYVLGGPSDVAYPNGMDDFARIKAVPAAVANHANVGHGGSFFEPNGGRGAQVAVAWLDWQLRGDASAATMFVGPDCGLCRDPEFKFQAKGF